jgi:hypothetical protein
MRLVFVLCVAPAILLTACAGEDEEFAELRARAAFDLECPRKQIHVVELDDRTKGVTGCGERATYIESCDRVGPWGVRSDCTWVLNHRTEVEDK